MVAIMVLLFAAIGGFPLGIYTISSESFLSFIAWMGTLSFLMYGSYKLINNDDQKIEEAIPLLFVAFCMLPLVITLR